MSRKVHISWLIAAASLPVVAGIAIAGYFQNFADDGTLGVVGVCLLLVAFINRRKYALLLAIAAGLLIGLARGGAVQNELSTYGQFFDKEVIVSGVIAEDPAFSPGGEQRITLKDVQIDNRKLSGNIWVNTNSHLDLKRSDHVAVNGTLEEGFGSFPAAIYRANIVDASRIQNADVARDVRDRFAEGVRSVVGTTAASLGLGYLVGQRTTLPEDLVEQLRILGLTHIVVASGYNLSILVRFSRRLFAGISKYLSVFSGLLMTTGFVLITGFSPSMTRAGLITALCLIAWYFGRAIHPFVLLGFGAAVTGLYNPFFVWGDLGWYLSFAAFGGVLILSPLLLRYFFGRRKPGSLLQIVAETTSAQLATLPIIALAFGQYAPLAIVSNMLILPLVPFAMIATFLAGLGGLIFGDVARWVGLPAEIILGYMLRVVDWLAGMPIASLEIDFTLTGLIAFYVLLVIFIVYLYRRTKYNFAESNIVE